MHVYWSTADAQLSTTLLDVQLLQTSMRSQPGISDQCDCTSLLDLVLAADWSHLTRESLAIASAA